MSDHDVVVLAAGGSHRLGYPKQLLRREGETLLHRVVRMAVASGAGRVLVVIGAYTENMQAAIADLPVETCINPHWQEGLASSLVVARQWRGDANSACLLLGCDQPALELIHLQQLLAGAAQARSACAVSAYEDAIGTPVVITADVFEDWMQSHRRGGLQAVLQALPADSLFRLQADELAFDIDTAQDVTLAVARGLLDGPLRVK